MACLATTAAGATRTAVGTYVRYLSFFTFVKTFFFNSKTEKKNCMLICKPPPLRSATEARTSHVWNPADRCRMTLSGRSLRPTPSCTLRLLAPGGWASRLSSVQKRDPYPRLHNACQDHTKYRQRLTFVCFFQNLEGQRPLLYIAVESTWAATAEGNWVVGAEGSSSTWSPLRCS